MNIKVLRKALNKIDACPTKRDEFLRMVRELGFNRAYSEVIRRAERGDTFRAKSEFRKAYEYDAHWTPFDINLMQYRLLSYSGIRRSRLIDKLINISTIKINYKFRPYRLKERIERLAKLGRHHINYRSYLKSQG